MTFIYECEEAASHFIHAFDLLEDTAKESNIEMTGCRGHFLAFSRVIHKTLWEGYYGKMLSRSASLAKESTEDERKEVQLYVP
ncbi:MAG TPA: hypothetical protein VGD98_20945 [Ktedonobacteraceae bacterium]